MNEDGVFTGPDGIQYRLGPTGPKSPWLKSDRQWFKNHKSRGHRLRRAYLGEQSPGMGDHLFDFALVRQEISGVRSKLFFDWLGNPDFLKHDEARLHAFYNMLISPRAEVKPIGSWEIEEAAEQLRNSWRTKH